MLTEARRTHFTQTMACIEVDTGNICAPDFHSIVFAYARTLFNIYRGLLDRLLYISLGCEPNCDYVKEPSFENREDITLWRYLLITI